MAGRPAVIAVVNQKGGTGKTTTSANLTGALARGLANGKKVLLVDMDPQADSTEVFLGREYALGAQQGPMVYEVLMEEAVAADVIREVVLEPKGEVPGGVLDILPAHLNLAGVEVELVPQFERERRLVSALAPILDRYHVVIIDCPPSLSLLTVNALMAATHVLVPINIGVFVLGGTGILMKTVEMVRRSNPGLEVLGVVLTQVDQRTSISRDVEAELRQHFGDRVLGSIPHRVTLKEAPAFQTDIFGYDPRGDGARAYGALAVEVWRRIQDQGG
jgi:chromosome partitioning protein